MAHIANGVGQGAARHLGANRRLVAMQQETHALAVMPREIVLHAADHDRGTVVSPHGVKRDQCWGCQVEMDSVAVLSRRFI
ncbi:hypothetical protein D3C81_1796390 [compost metagenome]